MLQLVSTVYDIREKLRQTVFFENIAVSLPGITGISSGTSGPGITTAKALEIMQYCRSPTATVNGLVELYPVESVVWGANLMAMYKGDLDVSEAQVQRYKEVVEILARGGSLTLLLQQYPDIVALGAYDLIHLDKWLKTQTFPT